MDLQRDLYIPVSISHVLAKWFISWMALNILPVILNDRFYVFMCPLTTILANCPSGFCITSIVAFGTIERREIVVEESMLELDVSVKFPSIMFVASA